LKKSEIKKADQWGIFNKKHANLLCNDNKIIKWYENNNYPDERVYITALYKYGLQNEIINFQTTYCVWQKGGKHPKLFPYIMENNLNNLLKSKFLFARKFQDFFVITNKKLKININHYNFYINTIKTKENNQPTPTILVNIGFDKDLNFNNQIIKKNNGNILKSLQNIIDNEYNNLNI
jgi:hypothetical protein